MAYFADLTPYGYMPRWEPQNPLNVGWLDAEHAFPTGPVEPEIVARLERISCYSVVQTRGLHDCEICASSENVYYQFKRRRLWLGSAEIRVFSADGEIFAAPTMLLHYISVHNYLPPPSFVDALNNGPIPPMQEYFDQLKERGYEWEETSKGDRRFKRRPPMRPPSWLIAREKNR